IYKNFQTKYSTGVTASSPITAFDKDKVTVTTIKGSDSAGFPNGAGVLKTYRDNSIDEFSYQEWLPFNISTIQYRKWNTTTKAWNSWVVFQPQSYITRDANN